MTDRQSNDLQRWADAWKIAGTRLEEERNERLRSMTDDDARKIIARIFSGPVPPRVPRMTGLIEQQRFFKLLK